MKKYLLPLFLLLAFCRVANAQPPVTNVDINNIGSCGTNGYAYLRFEANNAASYTWQVSTDGGNNWTVVTNNAYYTISYPYLYMNPTAGWNLYEYRCIASNTYGSDTSSVATLFITNSVPGVPAFVNPPTEVCQGSTVAFQATNVEAADTIFWRAPGLNIEPNFVISDSIVLINFPTAAASQNVSIYFIENGCGENFTNVITTLTVNPLQSTLAGTAGGGPDCASFSVYPTVATTYSDGTCSPIAAVMPSGSSPVSGTIQSCVTVDASVPTYNGVPYVGRYYNIEPTTNPSTSTATITLYFTQADFDAYNAARGSYPALPTGSSDATGIGNLTISQFHGTGTTPDTYVGTSGTIVPSSVVWNSTASRWEVTFSVTGFSGFFVSGGSIIPLPLTLTTFTGLVTAGGNQLQWKTSMEQNTAYFEIEREVAITGSLSGGSSDGFLPLGSVTAAGNSDQPLTYDYTDATAGDGASYSYRLKMVDLDGTFTYSKIVTLQSSAASFAINVSPNPYHQSLSVIVTMPQAAEGNMVVTDASGHRILQQALSLQKGANTLDPTPLTLLAPGIYFLSLTTGQEKQTVKLVRE